METGLSLAPGQHVGLLLGEDPSYLIDAWVAWLGKLDSEQAGEAGLEFLKPLPDSA